MRKYVTLEEFKERQEMRRNRIWKAMSASQKHYALMYLYRLKTDLEHIGEYIETKRFMELQLPIIDLPTFVHRMNPAELRKEAYDVIGKLGELPKEPA